jgi:transaldolase
MAANTQLAHIQKFTQVEIDSLDVDAAKALGTTFAGCTSNQGIVYAELSKPSNVDVAKDAIKLANEIQPDPTKRIGTAVKIATVMLNLRMLPYIGETGVICTQSSMRQAFSTQGTISDALEIISIFKRASPSLDLSRVCIKIPSTWEGLQAAKILREKHQINCLGTALFSLEQAILAHEVGCRFISPYLNELKAHFVPGFVDESKLFHVVKGIYDYYLAVGSNTQLLPASFRAVEDIFPLIGTPHMSIQPTIISELLNKTFPTDSGYEPPFSPKSVSTVWTPQVLSFVNDEAGYKLTINRKESVSRKIMEAINVFFEFEQKLEAIVKAAEEV